MKTWAAMCMLLIVTTCLNEFANAKPSDGSGTLSIPVTPLRPFPNGFISEDTYTFEFNELLMLDTKTRHNERIGVQVAGVLRRQGSAYYFYRNQVEARAGKAANAIKVEAINDPVLAMKRLRTKVVGGNVVIVGYFHRVDQSNGSLNIVSVRWYTGELVYPMPIIKRAE